MNNRCDVTNGGLRCVRPVHGPEIGHLFSLAAAFAPPQNRVVDAIAQSTDSPEPHRAILSMDANKREETVETSANVGEGSEMGSERLSPNQRWVLRTFADRTGCPSGTRAARSWWAGLRVLERLGLVERFYSERRGRGDYRLTRAGRAEVSSCMTRDNIADRLDAIRRERESLRMEEERLTRIAHRRFPRFSGYAGRWLAFVLRRCSGALR